MVFSGGRVEIHPVFRFNLPHIRPIMPSYHSLYALAAKPYIWVMEVNDALVNNLANLSRLQFSSGEKEIIKQDLQRMIEFVDKLKELDTTGVEPLMHMGDAVNVLREDVVQGSVSREEGLKNAPETDGVFFKVPKVIDKK